MAQTVKVPEFSPRHLGARLADLRKRLGAKQGGVQFVREFREILGLESMNEQTGVLESYRHPTSNERGLAPRRVPCSSIDLAKLAVAIGGSAFLEAFNPVGNSREAAALEDGAMDPSMMADVSLYRASVAGLVEAKILDAWNVAASRIEDLMEVVPTNRNGDILIGLGGFERSGANLERKPAMPHQRLVFGDRVVRTPETIERGAACELTKEVVFFNLNLQLLQAAQDIGEHLRYVRDNEALRTVLGITNSYNYNGVGYNTFYAAGGGGPWVNDHVNVAVDLTDIQNCRRLASRMTDPETGKEIEYDEVTTLMFDPDQEAVWDRILFGREDRFTADSRTTLAPLPAFATKQYVRVESTRARNVMIDAGIAEAEATQRWFYGNPKRAFKWMENQPLRVQTAAPSNYEMIDRGLVASYFADYRGVAAVWEPRYWIRNRAS